MKYYLAPLQSYTTAFYRCAHANTFGQMDKYFTPFFEQKQEKLKKQDLSPELDAHLNSNLNVIPQVATNDGHFLIDFTNKAEALGYKEININMGCPFPMLVKRQKGGGLLAHPELVSSMLDLIYNAHPDSLISVKMRTGLDDPEQGKQIIKLLNNYPLQEIILHPRLVTQKYDGQPDWQMFLRFRELSQHKVVANGDINSTSDLHNLQKTAPEIDTVMLGRGILTKPHLFTQLTEADAPQKYQELHNNYFKLITSYYKDWNRSFNFLQTFWYYPLNTCDLYKRHLRKLKKHNKPELYSLWLKTTFELLN